MYFRVFAACAALASGLANAAPQSGADYVDWRTFHSSAVNLGGWLIQEQFIDPGWWDQHAPETSDEWDFCVSLGSRCGPVLEKRYETYITTEDIDILAAAGINTLRIPTGYNAWVDVPGSQLYTGKQTSIVKKISDYAISNYGMHVILDLHSLPGGVNGKDIGEKAGNFAWFHNDTALEYSYQAVDAVIDFIQSSGHPEGFSLAPINEPVDNRNGSTFGSPISLSDKGAVWVLRYFQGVISRVRSANPRIPVVLQGGFKTEEFWSPKFANGTNIAFDIHQYYFEGRDTTSETLPQFLCGDAQAAPGDGKFPVFIGEWSIQAASQNTFDSRAKNLNTGLRAWSEYTQGSSYWTYKFKGNETVEGQGDQGDYWNYEDFIKWGIIHPSSGVPCA